MCPPSSSATCVRSKRQCRGQEQSTRNGHFNLQRDSTAASASLLRHLWRADSINTAYGAPGQPLLHGLRTGPSPGSATAEAHAGAPIATRAPRLRGRRPDRLSPPAGRLPLHPGSVDSTGRAIPDGVHQGVVCPAPVVLDEVIRNDQRMHVGPGGAGAGRCETAVRR